MHARLGDLSASHLASTAPYSLSLHDALPIYPHIHDRQVGPVTGDLVQQRLAVPDGGEDLEHFLLQQAAHALAQEQDRKSTRLNSSHVAISYAVFCLKKKRRNETTSTHGPGDA